MTRHVLFLPFGCHVPVAMHFDCLQTDDKRRCYPLLLMQRVTLIGLGWSLLLLSRMSPEPVGTGEGGGGAGTQYVKLLKPALLLLDISRFTS